MNRLSTKHLTFKGLLSLVVACPKLFCLWTPEVLQRVEGGGACSAIPKSLAFPDSNQRTSTGGGVSVFRAFTVLQGVWTEAGRSTRRPR